MSGAKSSILSITDIKSYVYIRLELKSTYIIIIIILGKL